MRLIDADALEKEGWSLCRTFRQDINTMVYEVKKLSDFSTIEERKTGEWISLDDSRGKYNDYGYKCSECGEHSDYEENFCPNCGADMRERKEE